MSKDTSWIIYIRFFTHKEWMSAEELWNHCDDKMSVVSPKHPKTLPHRGLVQWISLEVVEKSMESEVESSRAGDVTRGKEPMESSSYLS